MVASQFAFEVLVDGACSASLWLSLLIAVTPYIISLGSGEGALVPHVFLLLLFKIKL